MAHEIGHQVDVDNLDPSLCQVIGLIYTHDQEGSFEQDASCRGEYYGIDWNYTPPQVNVRFVQKSVNHSCEDPFSGLICL